jgi:sugar transferase EpsL
MTARGWYVHGLKPIADGLAAAVLLLVTSPILGAAALVVRVHFGAPVLFVQDRPGLHGRLFRLRKLRTMRHAHDPQGRPLPDAARLTSVGRWLRALSVDELPQLVNVLQGEMSLVGPRPLLPAYLDRYSPRQARRHDVRPGLTGWAQVHGRNAVDWAERLELDVWYVEHVGPLLDLRILGLTALRLLRPSGIAYAGHATMPEFQGAGEPAAEARDGAATPGRRA